MIIVDSNIWIFSETDNSEEHAMAAEKIRDIFRESGFGINAIIVSEVYHILSRILNENEALRRVRNILHHPLANWLPISSETALRAMELARRSHIGINDAIIARQALEVSASLLTDNVRDFRKVQQLNLIPLRNRP